MKFRYIVRTFVDASSPQEALRLASKTKPHEVYIDDRHWQNEGYALTAQELKIKGFEHKKRG